VDITKDTQPMTNFRNHEAEFMQHLKETKRPLFLTVNGTAAVVVQDAEAYQRLLALAANANVEEALRLRLESPGSLVLSVNRALWGEVTAQLRAVTATLKTKTIYLKFYFDGAPSDDDRESVGCIGSEVIADYPAPYLIEEEIIIAPSPEPILYEEDWMMVYRRKEIML